jgi:2-iminobutanoate/2-iminopropanoate deaminase
MIKPQPIETPQNPPNNATYSQAARLGDFVFLSGQLGIDPSTRLLVDGGIKAQTRQALENVRAVLAAAGSAMDLVAKVNIYITDFSLLSQMNEVYAGYFPHRPAKTTVEIVRLDQGGLIEIEVVAALLPR